MHEAELQGAPVFWMLAVTSSVFMMRTYIEFCLGGPDASQIHRDWINTTHFSSSWPLNLCGGVVGQLGLKH